MHHTKRKWILKRKLDECSKGDNIKARKESLKSPAASAAVGKEMAWAIKGKKLARKMITLPAWNTHIYQGVYVNPRP